MKTSPTGDYLGVSAFGTPVVHPLWGFHPFRITKDKQANDYAHPLWETNSIAFVIPFGDNFKLHFVFVAGHKTNK